MANTSWVEAFKASPGPASKKDALFLYLKGICMGAADLIPGVSGGTVAFITGIYEDLLEAISSVNKELLMAVIKLDVKKALGMVHAKFLVVLFGGILTSIFALANLMHFLMNNHKIHTWSLFLGLIVASIVVIFKQLDKPFQRANMLWIVIGTLFAYLVVGLIPVTTPKELWFIFICGLISISAMILPGLSGSFLLLILGKYEYITGAVKDPFVPGNWGILFTFVAGAIVGALGFTKVLNWFLKHYRSLTMAFLTGILVGSLRKVWPWKEVLETQVISGKVRILREANIIPALDSHTLLSIFFILTGLVVVLLLERLAAPKKTKG
jgi:putative membrane protein